MAKYDPLQRYLRRQSSAEVVLTFSEIENLLTTLLPRSSRRREWWANESLDDTTSVQCRPWMRAGYMAFPEVDREQVLFRKTGQNSEIAMSSSVNIPKCK